MSITDRPPQRRDGDPPRWAPPERRAIHGYVSIDAHGGWHQECAQHGISVSGLLEVLGAELPDLLAHPDWAHLIKQARKVDAVNRRRKP